MNVSGKLVGQSGTPVEGAKVQVLDGESEISSSDSGSDGGFSCIIAERWIDKRLVLSVAAYDYPPFRLDLQLQGDTDLRELSLGATKSKPPEIVTTPDPQPEGWLRKGWRVVRAFLSIMLQSLVVIGWIIAWIAFLLTASDKRDAIIWLWVLLTTAAVAVLVYFKARKRKP